jgi:hypothetical protein
MKEYDFVIDILLDSFNSQYLKNFNRNDFDLSFISKKEDLLLAYELTTKRPDDNFVIRGYFSIGEDPFVEKFRVENINPKGPTDTDVYVTQGVLSESDIEFSDLTKEFLLFPRNTVEGGLLLEDDGGYILSEDGTVIVME